jgi:hypothetical protein
VNGCASCHDQRSRHQRHRWQAQTIDAKIAELIDSKAGLAARALDGEDFDEAGSTSVQLDALSHLLEEALAA